MKSFKLLVLVFVLVISCKQTDSKEYSMITADQTAPLNLQNPDLEKSIERGAMVYEDFCAQCHLPDGSGVDGVYPPLNNSNWLSEKRTASIRALKYGLSGEITVNGQVYNSMMMDQGLSEQEIADVMNYTLNSWDNDIQPPVTIEEVTKVQEQK
ncbi:c-type cytochrome [Croceiramulus getboli]|nr:cytochrome c [Flavobacteriaceae bacterium YJPT1-3]